MILIREIILFVSDDILNNVKDNESTNNEKKPENKPWDFIIRNLLKSF